MRLIDADRLLKDNPVHVTGRILSRNGKAQNIDAIQISAIDAAPTVDAVEVVHGKWEDIPNRYICTYGDKPYRGNATSCSVCHDVNPNAFKTNYCPNCGAKMGGERKDGNSNDES